MSTRSGVHIVESSLRQKIENRANRDFYLQNPHLWADRVIGRDLYEKHILEGGEWLGWQPKQVAFLRDTCDSRIKKLFAICNRGGSKTWLTAIGSACQIDNYDRLKVSIVSGSFEQASQCYEYMGDFFRESQMKDKVLGDVTMKRTRFAGGGIARVLAASTKRTKAPRSDIVIIDEACEAKSQIIKTVLPQAITAIFFKLIVLTTPDEPTHIVKEWWDLAPSLGFALHHWTAYDCKWIPAANIEEYRNLFDEATFRTQVLAEWTGKGGNVFRYPDIQAAICSMSDLPPLTEMDRFFMGIDWGDAHPTVAIILGMRGDVAKGTDEWFVYYTQEWRAVSQDIIVYGGYQDLEGNYYTRREAVEKFGSDEGLIEIWGLRDIVELYRPSIYSEQSPIGAHGNRELRKALMRLGVTIRLDSFSQKKHAMVANLRGTLEKKRIKIPRYFRVLIDQLTSYSYKIVNEEVRDEFKKVNDDYVDALNWARWCIHPATDRLIQIGELGELDVI